MKNQSISQSINQSIISLAAIMKNEGYILLEWISYYQALGFDQIVIYDDNSTDGTTELLSALHMLGIVTHKKISPYFENRQRIAYNLEVKNTNADWTFFFDADEFLVLEEDNIHNFVNTFPKDAGQICINWKTFGTSGYSERPNGFAVSHYIHCAKLDYKYNAFIKSGIKTEAAIQYYAHRGVIAENYKTYHSSGVEIVQFPNNEAKFIPANYTKAQLNHLITRSSEDFISRRARGDVAHQQKELGEKSRDDFLVFNSLYNDIDRRYQKFHQKHLYYAMALAEKLILANVKSPYLDYFCRLLPIEYLSK